MNLQRARVSMFVTSGERTRPIAAGDVVDFDERLTETLTLGEAVSPDHFEPMPDVETAPVRSRRKRPDEESQS